MVKSNDYVGISHHICNSMACIFDTVWLTLLHVLLTIFKGTGGLFEGGGVIRGFTVVWKNVCGKISDLESAAFIWPRILGPLMVQCRVTQAENARTQKWNQM